MASSQVLNKGVSSNDDARRPVAFQPAHRPEPRFQATVIGFDPVRYRMAMLPAMLEKGSFAIAIPILYAFGRVPSVWLGFASMDATWLALFVVAFFWTPKEPPPVGKTA